MSAQLYSCVLFRDQDNRHRPRDEDPSRELKRSYDMRSQREELEKRAIKERRRSETQKDGGHVKERSESVRKPTKRSHSKKSSKERGSSTRLSTERPSGKSSASEHRTRRTEIKREKPDEERSSSRAPINWKDVKIKDEPDKDPPLPLAKLTPEEIIEQEKKVWIRSAPADLYYSRDRENPDIMKATDRSKQLHDHFEEKLIKIGVKAREKWPKRDPPNFIAGLRPCDHDGGSDSSDTEDESQNYRVSNIDYTLFFFV